MQEGDRKQSNGRQMQKGIVANIKTGLEKCIG